MRIISTTLTRLHIDPYIAAILCSVGIAAMLPADGGFAAVLDHAGAVAVTLLFFLYGARLRTAETLRGLGHWRLHTVILSVTFLIFPLLAIGCSPLAPGLLTEHLYHGVVFLCVLPSTVQTSITLTSIARGNEAGAICSASLSNVLGVVLTPLLATALISAESGGISLGSVRDIALRILLPFLLGQVAQRRIGDFVRARRRALSRYDRAVILLMVYTAFSQGVVDDIWDGLAPAELAVLALVIMALLAVTLTLAALLARIFGFSRADRVTMLFCGSQKSLASGLPMATVLFAGASVSTMILPLMLYHQLQLLVCSWLAQRFAAAEVAETAQGAEAGEPAPATA
ncbi:bile acid:sodium symporter [Spirillospora sp. NBC_00431]